MATTIAARRIQTSIGPAWQASCSCGWEGQKYWARGARDTARSERWSHELDHEDGLVPDTHPSDA